MTSGLPQSTSWNQNKTGRNDGQKDRNERPNKKEKRKPENPKNKEKTIADSFVLRGE